MSNTILSKIARGLGIGSKNDDNSVNEDYNNNATQNYLDQQTNTILNQNTFLKKFSLISSLCNILLIVGIIYIGSMPKQQPYLLVIDKNTGSKLDVIDVQKDATPSEIKAIRQKEFIRIVEGLLAVSPDIAMQDKIQKDVKNYILPNSFALKFINDTLAKKENDPYELNKKYIVIPKVVSLLPATYAGESPNAYDFEVESKWYDRKGTFLTTETIKGSLLYEEIKAKDAETLIKNPTGTYISKIVWQQKINQNSNINK
jgi:type IV secretory pathway TrbF-like protein